MSWRNSSTSADDAVRGQRLDPGLERRSEMLLTSTADRDEAVLIGDDRGDLQCQARLADTGLAAQQERLWPLGRTTRHVDGSLDRVGATDERELAVDRQRQLGPQSAVGRFAVERPCTTARRSSPIRGPVR